jgi:hypothetical protein
MINTIARTGMAVFQDGRNLLFMVSLGSSLVVGTHGGMGGVPASRSPDLLIILQEGVFG